MRSTRGASVLAVAILAAAALAAATTLVVKIQTTQLRKSPQFFAPAVATLKSGDRLEKISESGGWVQVKTAGGAVGWIHGSAVETPKSNLLAMGAPLKTQATASEAALAGKGFNKQVEDSYKAKHAEANFAAVDRMLQVRTTLAQVQEFLKAGRLGEAAMGGSK